jgi:Cytochrome c.
MKSISLALFAVCCGAILSASDEAPVLKQYCAGCHGKAATAGINLEQLTAVPMADGNFAQWQKVAAVLEDRRMPPPKMPQPSDADRAAAAQWVRANLKSYAEKRAGDPRERHRPPPHQRGVWLHRSGPDGPGY